MFKKILTTVVLASAVMACSSNDFVCDETQTPVPPVPESRLITLGEYQAVLNPISRKSDEFVNIQIDFQNSIGVEDGKVMTEARVMGIRRMGEFTAIHADFGNTQKVMLAKGDGSVYAVLADNVADGNLMNYVYLPRSIANATDNVMFYDYRYQTFHRFDSNLNKIDEIALKSQYPVRIDANTIPTFHKDYMTIAVSDLMQGIEERHVFTYEGNRYQGWIVADGSFALGVTEQSHIVYAKYDQKVGKYMIASVDTTGTVEEIGYVNRHNVFSNVLLESVVKNQFVGFYGNAIDVKNRSIVADICSSLPSNTTSVMSYSTDTKFVCPVTSNDDVEKTGFFSTYERFNPVTGEREFVSLSRPSRPIRAGTESVTLEYVDYGVTSMHDNFQTTADLINVSDFAL